MPSKVRIALDAMGGDVGPAVVIPGTAISLQRHRDTEFLLVGDRARIEDKVRALKVVEIVVVDTEGRPAGSGGGTGSSSSAR
jgi:fatty acid/phospholipid biosynthesis enzyme